MHKKRASPKDERPWARDRQVRASDPCPAAPEAVSGREVVKPLPAAYMPWRPFGCAHASQSVPRTMRTSRLHASDHFRPESLQDLCQRLSGAEERRPRNQERRDIRPARPERRRKDHADRHYLRHRDGDFRPRLGGRPRHRLRLPGHPFDDRARAAGGHHRRFRVSVGDGFVEPRTFRQAQGPGARREGVEGPVAVGEEGREGHHAFRAA